MTLPAEDHTKALAFLNDQVEAVKCLTEMQFFLVPVAYFMDKGLYKWYGKKTCLVLLC